MEQPMLRVFWHDAMLDHATPASAHKLHASELFEFAEPHPDRPERVTNIAHAIRLVIPEARWETPSPATPVAISRIHDPEYVAWFRDLCADGGGWIADTTTGAGPNSYRAARYAVGAAVDAMESALHREGIAYALCRPSGHHAQPDRADGFCFFNNAAVAADRALDSEGIESVAILDWDVHHGNGTQECFYDRNDVLLLSAHNDHGSWDDYYHPQTGSVEEVGVGAGEGYTVNIPLPPGTGNAGYSRVFQRLVEPIIGEYDPDIIIASSGADPGVSDPLGRNTLTRPGFRDLGRRTRELATQYASDRLVVIQEGGYQPTHLVVATLGVFEGVLGREFDLTPFGIDGDPYEMYTEYEPAVTAWLDNAVQAHAAYWSL